MRKGLSRARRLTALLCTTVGAGLALAAPSQAETIYAVTAPGGMGNQLVSFDSATPNSLITTVPVTGLQPGEDIRGIDFRPATGQLYAVASSGTFVNRIYTVNKATGVATQVGTGTFTTTGEVSGFDFNPVPGAIRVITEVEENLRINATTGAVAVVDTPLTGATKVVGAAYTNNAAGANNTTLYGIDVSGANDRLVRIGGPGGSPSPNGGEVNDRGPLQDAGGNNVNLDDDAAASFDVSGQTGTAYLVGRLQGETVYRFRRVYLDGQPPTLGLSGDVVGSGDPVRGMAVELPPGSLQFAASTFGTNEAAGAAVTVTRTGNSDAQATVNYATTNGTAVAGEDYTAATGTLTFAPGENVKTFTIPVTDDDVVEPTETINVALSAVTSKPANGASLGAPNAAVVGLFDNDETPPVTPTPDPPQPDTMRPRVLVSAPNILTYTQARSRKGLAVEASCSEACVFAAELRVGTKLLGTRSASTSSAGVVSLPIRFSAAGRRELARRLPKPRRGQRPRSIRITLRVSATDAAGLTTVRNRFIRIVR